jgi:methanogenic corrinoid protein MtbC1
MVDEIFSAMTRSIVDGAPDTAAVLAQNALRAGVAPLDAINLGFVPGCIT